MARFIVGVPVYCDMCPMALMRVAMPDGTCVLKHGRYDDCPRSGQVFKDFAIELEQIKQAQPTEGAAQ